MRRIFLATAFALGFFAVTSQASVITFDRIQGGSSGFGTYFESGFLVIDVSSSWSPSELGAPGPAIIGNPGRPNSALGIIGLAFDTFTFSGLEIAAAAPGVPSVLSVLGSLNGHKVFDYNINVSSAPTFTHYTSQDTGAVIDTLTLFFSTVGGARPIVDNIELNGIASTATPEPATLASAGLAVVAGLVAHRRRRAA